MDSLVIRQMELNDLESVSAICINAFLDSIAPTLSEEGIANFICLAQESAFKDRMKQDNLLFVAEQNNSITGVVELKQGKHIAMFFINPKNQKKGIGKKILNAITPFAREHYFSVNAALTSINAYKNFGFESDGAVAQSDGLIYQPMKKQVNNACA